MTLAVVEGTGEVVNTMEKVNNKLSKLKLESPESLSGDPRYTFTEEELECVKELKALCEKDGIQYTSIYELAKYQIGVWSDGPEKRVANAFKNLKKRRAFEEKHASMFANDFDECVAMMEEDFPDFYDASGFVRDGLRHVAVWVGSLNHSQIMRDPAVMEKIAYFYLEVTRLCTIDLEELRTGMGVLTDYCGIGALGIYSCLKFVKALSDLTAGPAHAVRLKKVTVLMPEVLNKFANLGIAVAPKKLQSRIQLCNNLKKYDLDMSEVPPHYGGTFNMSTSDWCNKRMAEFEIAAARIQENFESRV